MLLEDRDTALLITDAEVFAPTPLGRQEVLIVAGRVLAIGRDLQTGNAFPVRRIDARGRLLVPGFVDSLVHIGGGGGEGGFATRAHPLRAEDALRAGVTTLIGALGTDEVTRSHADLLACARALNAEGLSAFVLSGSYRVPVATLTGSVRTDLVLIPEMLGVGEIAIADHRGSQPSFDELARIGADARVGGMLAGKRGTVLIHVGDGDDGIDLLEQLSARTPLPRGQWHPTHMSRNARLFEQGRRWLHAGGSIDITASTSAELLEAGEVPPLRALLALLEDGAPIERITLSTDGQASLPRFDAQGDCCRSNSRRCTACSTACAKWCSRTGWRLSARCSRSPPAPLPSGACRARAASRWERMPTCCCSMRIHWRWRPRSRRGVCSQRVDRFGARPSMLGRAALGPTYMLSLARAAFGNLRRDDGYGGENRRRAVGPRFAWLHQPRKSASQRGRRVASAVGPRCAQPAAAQRWARPAPAEKTAPVGWAKPKARPNFGCYEARRATLPEQHARGAEVVAVGSSCAKPWPSSLNSRYQTSPPLPRTGVDDLLGLGQRHARVVGALGDEQRRGDRSALFSGEISSRKARISGSRSSPYSARRRSRR
jgi:beta-aspartyl-dipeptidase (metallo-type)